MAVLWFRLLRLIVKANTTMWFWGTTISMIT